MKSKKIIIIVTLITIILMLSLATTFAIWTTLPAASVLFEMGVVNENPSLKYQIFVPVDAEYNRINGIYNFATKIYTLDDPLDSINIAGLGLVGYEGGIAVDRLQVPDTFLYNIGGEVDTYQVSCVLVDPEFSLFYFRGNSEIYTIIISQNVKYIADGAFMGMENLTTLIYHGTGEILVGDFVFVDCRKLTNPQTPEGRVVVGR